MGKRFHGNGNEGWFWEKYGHKLRRAGKENDSVVGWVPRIWRQYLKSSPVNCLVTGDSHIKTR